jgi:hypothetical protein
MSSPKFAQRGSLFPRKDQPFYPCAKTDPSEKVVEFVALLGFAAPNGHGRWLYTSSSPHRQRSTLAIMVLMGL